MKLMIVESPNKVKKIEEMLGVGWKVMASVGHVRDLDEKELSVNEETFKPKYVFIPPRKVPGRENAFPGGKQRVARIAKAAKEASEVYLATDPDREGEAIAWHLAVSMKLQNPKRITFAEITEKAVKRSLAQPRKIDMDLVHAQEARRVLDRLYGFKVSRTLSEASGVWRTAGRVQSPAVLLVVMRERAIRNFKPTTHYSAKLFFGGWYAEWQIQSVLGEDEKYCLDIELAKQAADLKKLAVSEFSDSERKESPAAPFTTSSLQQAASTHLKMRPKIVMDTAQKLYEQGVITYHRTDDPNLSEDAFEELEAYAASEGLEIHPERRKWKSKSGSQEAHEAIRPTDITVLNAGTTDEEQALYDLIRKRALAVVLPDAVYAVRNVLLEADTQILGKDPLFSAKGSTLIKEGWRLVYNAEEEGDEEKEDNSNNPIPKLATGEVVHADKGNVLTKKTKAPARYTEATLVRDMEKRGIGRPSTYAAIIENISRRKYIEADKKRKLHATEVGESLIDSLVGKFEFVDLDFTAELENDLDKIAAGKRSYFDVVSVSANALSEELGELKDTVKPEFPCESCGSAMRQIKGANGVFWGCSGYPNCKETRPDNDGQPGEKVVKAQASSKHKCPDCDSPLVHRIKKGAKGYDFWGCSAFPKCKKTFNSDGEGQPIFK